MEPRFALNRRQMLSATAGGVVASAMPFGPPAFANTASTPGRAKSVLLVILSGGLSQLETFDPKPHAPAEIRGDFDTIGTSIPGVAIAEHTPRLASQLDRWSIVRSMSHVEENHLLAMHVALTGRPTPIPRGGSDLDRVESRFDFPNYASALDVLRPRQDGIPTGVTLPNYFIEGPLTWPGQYAGFLGPKHDPWQINQDPNHPEFRIDSLTLQPGTSTSRMVTRRQLLEEMNQGRTAAMSGVRTNSFASQQEIAFSMLTSDRVAKAFEIQDEPDSVRDRYGRHKFGQSLLLSRRLIQAGIPVVQAAMGIVQNWDTHVDNWGRLKNTLLPPLDQGLAALMDDLSSMGLLEQTLVIVTGEFGRTPKISKLPGEHLPGRDHWARAYSALFAGAGVRGGQVIGQTDSIAAYPLSQPWSPADMCTTIYQALGVGHDAVLHDPLGRPNHLCNGSVIEPLYSGRMS